MKRTNQKNTPLVSLANDHPALAKLTHGKRPPEPKRLNKKEIVIDLSPVQDFATTLTFIKRGLAPTQKSEIPGDLKPMLAGVAEKAFNSEDWQFEIKWDGYRAISYLENGTVKLRSRNNLSFNDRFGRVTQALKDWGINAVIDGEVVVLNDDGHADFEALQGWHQVQQGTLVYFVFDILWLDGYNLMNMSLLERRKILTQLIPQTNIIRFSDSIDEAGIDFFKVAENNGLEGIIAKRKDAIYYPSTRTKNWLKIKSEEKHEAVICGYTKNKGTQRLFSSLVLGLPQKTGMLYIGQVGTGFDSLTQKALFKKMNPLFSTACPFPEVPNTSAPTMWVTPYLVCEVKYTELTSEGVMRHPSFQGIREDKNISDLNLNDGDPIMPQKPVKKVASGGKESSAVKPSAATKNPLVKLTSEPKKTPEAKTSAQPENTLVAVKQNEAMVTVNKQQLKLTNLQKLYWKNEKICKGDLLNYYHSMAAYILPYMKDRPQSLNRYPNGIDGENFYHKDMNGKVESWIKTHRRFSESVNENKDFLVCTNEASLLYMANMGCIEMNPWHSRTQKPDAPDWSVIDLDPGTNSFEEVIETALVVKKVLDSAGITSYVKTSGSTGIHIYVPFGGRYSYDQSKSFAELIANIVHNELPLLTSLERSPLKRKDKIYLDYLQNRPIQTICAPYSCRPKVGATVSTPLHWDEVKPGLDMQSFTIFNILDRVKAEGDLFEGVLGKGINLNTVIKQLSQIA